MNKMIKMPNSIKIFHWLPRLLCIALIIFISQFSLDAFGYGLTVSQQIISFIMHLIPSFILIVLLIYTWQWEYFGGILFCIIGVFFSIALIVSNYVINQKAAMSFSMMMFTTIPIILVGVLFIVSFKKKEKWQNLSKNIRSS